jgi:Bacterial RNA polymerase, alpha chain C terminal domain
LKVNVSFANPFPIAIYTVSLLLIGFAIGSSYGHTLAACWMLLIATILLLLHDVAIAVLLASAASRVASTDRNRERELTHTEAESPERRRSKPRALSQNPRTFSVFGKARQHLSRREYLKLHIEEMEFSVRTHNCLKYAGIQTVRALVHLSEEELLHDKFTPEMITEIKGTLASIGLQLRRHVGEE